MVIATFARADITKAVIQMEWVLVNHCHRVQKAPKELGSPPRALVNAPSAPWEAIAAPKLGRLHVNHAKSRRVAPVKHLRDVEGIRRGLVGHAMRQRGSSLSMAYLVKLVEGALRDTNELAVRRPSRAAAKPALWESGSRIA